MGNCDSTTEQRAFRKVPIQNNNQKIQINKNIPKTIIVPSKPVSVIQLTNFKFVLSTGEKIPFSADENLNFRQIFTEFVKSKCPINRRKDIKAVLYNAEKVDFNKTAKENKIREGSVILVIILDSTQNSTNQNNNNNVSQSQNYNNFNNNYSINIIPLILKNINITKNIRPKNLHELKEKIEKFYAFYINDYRVQNDIIINLMQDKNILAKNIQQYYNSRIRGFEFSKNLLMDSHLREYNENTITCENDYYMKNKSISYNRQEIEEDLRENYRDFIDEKKSILNTFINDASELKEDLENDLKYERNYYMSERQQILQNDDSWERFKELNKLEKEYKNNIKEIKEGYYQSFRNLRERRDDNLRDNENDYEERKRKLNNKKRELEEYDNVYNNYMMNKSNIEYNYSIKMQNANNEFVNNIEMLRINLTNELNTLEREFNEQLNKLKMFYSQNNNMR